MLDINLLHITDLHAKTQDKDQLELRMKAMFEDIERTGIQFDGVLFTGDLAFAGKVDEYELADRIFLSRLSSRLHVPKTCIHIAPGNHDVDLSLISFDDERHLDEAIHNTVDAESFVNDKRYSHTRLGNYYRYMSAFKKASPQTCAVHVEKIKGITTGFACLNSAWRSCGRTGEHDLYVTELQVNQALGEMEDCHLKIALLHHTLDCLHPSESEAVIPDLKRQFDVIVTGHLHNALSAGEVLPGAGSLILTSPAISDGRERVGYNIYRIRYEDRQIDASYRKFVRPRREFDKDTDHAPNGEWSYPLQIRSLVSYHRGVLYHRLSNASSTLDQALKENLQKLQQVSAPIYVPAPLRGVTWKEGEKHYSRLEEDMASLASGFHVIFGPKETGKSILLMAAAADIDRSMPVGQRDRIAVYVDLADAHNISIEKTILEEIAQFTPEGSQTDPLEIVVFVDHLVDRDDRHMVQLRQMQEKHGWCVVTATANSLLFDALMASSDFGQAKFYQLDYWGPSRIREMTRQFLSGGTLDADAAFEFVSNSLKDTDLPSTPLVVTLYLLVFQKLDGYLSSLSFLHLLQRFEIMRLGEIDNSGENSLYYKQRVLALIAAECLRQDTDILPTREVVDMIDKYFGDRLLEVDSKRFISSLVDSGVLELSGDHLRFQYYVFFDYYLAQAFQQGIVDVAESMQSLYQCVCISGALALHAGLIRENAGLVQGIMQQMESSFKAVPRFTLADLDKYVKDLFFANEDGRSVDEMATADLESQPDMDRMDADFSENRDAYGEQRKAVRHLQERRNELQEIGFLVEALKTFYQVFRNLEGMPGDQKVKMLNGILDYHILCNTRIINFLHGLMDDSDAQTILAYLTTISGQEFLTQNMGNQSLRLAIEQTVKECDNDLKELLLLFLYGDLRLPGYERCLQEFVVRTDSRAAVEMAFFKIRQWMILYSKPEFPVALITAFKAIHDRRMIFKHGQVGRQQLGRMFQDTLNDTKEWQLMNRMSKQGE